MQSSMYCGINEIVNVATLLSQGKIEVLAQKLKDYQIFLFTISCLVFCTQKKITLCTCFF